MVKLPATAESFTGWIAHAEVRQRRRGKPGWRRERIGEHGGRGGEGGGEGSSEAVREAAMSSPITPLDQPWNGVLGGLAVSAQYRRRNPVHQRDGAKHPRPDPVLHPGGAPPEVGNPDRGRAGPRCAGQPEPGQQAVSSLSVAGEPSLAGVCLRRVRGARGGIRLRRSRSRAPYRRGKR